MREYAEAVRNGADEPDQWFAPEEIVAEFMWGDQPQHGDVEADARHIAAWSPPVALAVADLLDTAGADLWAYGPLCECGGGCNDCDDSLWQPYARRALVLCDAWEAGQP